MIIIMKDSILAVLCLIHCCEICYCESQGSIRLTTDSTATDEGIVEIYYNNRWGSVDGRGFNDKTASVICRLLGLGEKGSEIEYYHTRNSTKRIFYYLFCDGNETNILDCRYSATRGSGYNTLYAAGVICKEFNSSNIRLDGGSQRAQGKVQFLFDGQWMGMCEDSVDIDNYHVACKQMGYRVVEKFDQDLSVRHDMDRTLPFQYSCSSYNTFESCAIRKYSYKNCSTSGRIIIKCSKSRHLSGGTTSVLSYVNKLYAKNYSFEVTEIRLVDGTERSNGRVELYDGKWKTVCSKGFSNSAADTVCKQGGWRTALSSDEIASYGDEEIIACRIVCYSRHTNISNCYLYSENYTCTHENDVSLECSDFQVNDIRLIDGKQSSEGRIELLLDGKWRTLCDRHITYNNLDVICKAIGYRVAMKVYRDAHFGEGVGDIINNRMYCSSTDNHVNDCDVRYYGDNCSHSDDLSVACSRYTVPGVRGIVKNQIYCSPNEVHINNCNVSYSDYNCYTYSRAVNCSHFQIEDVRLADGLDSSQGRIELLIEGTWMTFCDDTFNNDNFDVVCKMKGYRTARNAYRSAHFGPGVGDIVTNWIDCTSTDFNINNCKVRYSGYRCSHYEDLSVACSYFVISGTRLVNGTNSKEGRIELHVDGEWMTVCDSTFLEGYGLDTVCKTRGYRGVIDIFKDAHFGKGSGEIVTHYFSCPTDAESLTDCDVRYSGYSGCRSHLDDLSVACSDLQIHNIRLVDGDYANEGRVEILVDDEWRTVCASYWSKNDMDVLCRNLGFEKMEKQYSNAYFGGGRGKILSTDFECNGAETNLKNCSMKHNGNICTHSSDLSIKCVACGSLKIPHNGFITTSGTLHGDFARFECKPGFEVKGSSLRVCQSNNTWNGTEAECIRGCGSLPAPVNGFVILPTNTLYQAVIRFECDSGFDIIGMANRTCQENLTWSGSTPICMKVSDDDNKIKNGLLYGGITGALTILLIAGILVVVYVVRKRRSNINTPKPENISTCANRAFEENYEDLEAVTSPNTYDSLDRTGIAGSNSADQYENVPSPKK